MHLLMQWGRAGGRRARGHQLVICDTIRWLGSARRARVVHGSQVNRSIRAASAAAAAAAERSRARARDEIGATFGARCALKLDEGKSARRPGARVASYVQHLYEIIAAADLALDGTACIPVEE